MYKFLFLFLVTSALFSCKEPQNENVAPAAKTGTSPEENMYRVAIERNDPYTMLYAINGILARDSSRTELLDTLLDLYLNMGNPTACAHVAEEILKKDPKNERVLAIAGESYSSIQQPEKAVNFYKRLYDIRPEYEIQYQLGLAYVNIGDETNALRHLNNVVNNRKETDQIKVEQQMPSVPGKTQKVKLPAVAYVALGYYYANSNQANKAMDYFKKALTVEPLYDMAAYAMLELKRSKK